MTTATKSLHDQLADLERRAAKARTKAREASDAKTRYEAEAHELRARYEHADADERKTIQVEVDAREQSRIHNVGPYADAVNAAVAPFHAIDNELQSFKRTNLRGLIAETIDGADQAIDQIREGWELIANAGGLYMQACDRTRELVTNVGGMDGQDVGFDRRVDDWRRVATANLAHVDTVIAPQLTELGNWKVDNYGD